MDMERIVAGNLRAEFAHACRTMRSAWQQLLEVSVRAFGKSPKDKDVRIPGSLLIGFDTSPLHFLVTLVGVNMFLVFGRNRSSVWRCLS